MSGQNAAGSVFMCRLCNLFSPSRSQLLSHCSQLHPQQEPSDDIIITLQPLVGEPVETPSERPAKNKRGRPKGSKNKTHSNLKEGKSASTFSPLQNVQTQNAEETEEGDRQRNIREAESTDRTFISTLECRNCHRSFSNRRQILKHICLKEEDGEEDREDNGSVSGGVGNGASESVNPGGETPSQIQQNSQGPKPGRKKASGRNPKAERSSISKEGGQSTGKKKSVISVVLTEDEALPGVTKMVPVEESSADTEPASNSADLQPSAVLQSQSHELTSETPESEGMTKTDQETSSANLTFTTTSTKGGIQEYSIKHDAHNLQQSQLKIFACEFCNKIFKFRHSLVAHLRTHTQEKPFQCPHCDYASAIKVNLNVHLRKHTGEKFSCQHCAFACISRGHLKVHVERVHMKVKQHCSFCQKKYSDVKNLLKHMEKQHNLKDPAVQQSYQQLRLKTRQGLREILYHCPTCNRRFKNQLERQRHMFIHGPRRPFACLLCDHATTRMARLTAHIRTHLFLYVCSVCGGKFVSSQKLRSHLEETHPELEQELAFNDSINSSFCLSQPGGDMWGEEREDAEERTEGELRIEQDEGTREEEGKNGVIEEEWQNGNGEQMDIAESQEREQEDEEDAKLRSGCAEGKQVGGEETGKGEESHNGVVQIHKVISMEAKTLSSKEDEATAEEISHLHNNQTVLTSENIHMPPLENNTNPADENTSSLSGHLCDPSVHTSLSAAPPGDNTQSLQSQKGRDVFHESAFQQVISSLLKTRLNVESFQRLRKVYGELECQYCGKLFMYKVHYNVHVRTHTKEHSHYCSKCSYSAITKSSLKRHQIQKHSDVLLPCSSPGCTYTTPDKYKLQAHLKTHKEKRKSVTCSFCQKSYPEHRLKHHIKTSHPDTLAAQGKGPLVQRAEKCPYCDSYFVKNSSDFQRHIWAHEGVKPYVCTVCDYTSRSRSNLKTHMNRHNTERSHLCDLCGKKFKSKVTLKSHSLSHTDEGKRFQCSECDFTSVFKPSLLRHMEQHAEFKPFRCAHCHYSCNIAGPLKRHYKLKHPDQKYENAGPGQPDSDALKQQGGMKCPECEYVYGTKWELNRHLKSKHCLKVVGQTWEVGETVEAQFVTVEGEEQLIEAPVAALQDNVDIQQINEFSSETHDAVTSMVAMAPGTVTVVQQLQVADEQEVGDCSNQLMVVNADGGLTGEQVMVVEDANGLEALTVLTQGENTHHYIVYVQEHTVEIN